MNEDLKKNYIYFKPIETERLIIRELNIDDVYSYFDFANDEEVFRYMNASHLKQISEAKQIIDRAIYDYNLGNIFRLGIHLKDENKIIGFIGLSKYDLSLYSCQIIYAIGKGYWNKGYVSEVVSYFVRYLKSIGKKLIIAGHVEENVNSGKVLLKNGFIRDPRRDTQMIIHGELKNIINYSIDERN